MNVPKLSNEAGIPQASQTTELRALTELQEEWVTLALLLLPELAYTTLGKCPLTS